MAPEGPGERRLAARRPMIVTLAAWAFILTGGGGILKDVLPLAGPGRAGALDALLAEGAPMLAFIWFVRALAVVGGIGVLCGRTWARTLLVAWMTFHVGISLAHSLGEAAAHVAIFAVLTWAMFRQQSSNYFRAARAARNPPS